MTTAEERRRADSIARALTEAVRMAGRLLAERRDGHDLAPETVVIIEEPGPAFTVVEIRSRALMPAGRIVRVLHARGRLAR